MGNEQSNKGVAKAGENHEKRENGAAHGLSVNITSNGLENDGTSGTAVQQNAEPAALNPTTESNEPDAVMVKTDCHKDEVQVISKDLESTTVTEKAMETKEVTPTKTPKRETATPDATKDQSQKETQPAATTTVAQVSEPPAAPKGMSVPPPPPPEPPKLEIKGEPAAKSVTPTPKEEPKAAAKVPEASKGKSAKDAFSKFFRPKQVDASKTSTLEAAAKPAPPPPVQEQEKPPSKKSLISFFKTKPAEPKKGTPASPAAAEAVQTVKAKEEAKPAAKSAEAPVDNKLGSVSSQTGDDAANVPNKLEKRNSINLFFKNLMPGSKQSQ